MRGVGGLPHLLLALLLFLAVPRVSAAQSHAAYLNSLSFKCQEDYVFSSTNTVFAVDIARLPPEEIAIYLNSIPNNVELVSIKKVTYIPPASTGQGYGTHVEITVRFFSTGDIKLFAADLETKDGFFKIPFPTVHVWTNMQILKPEISVSVDGKSVQDGEMSCSVGDHVGYTVRVKYASSVRSISYEIPENSIFTERERLMKPDDGASQSGDFSPDFKDAARYDWRPLVTGDFELPPVNLVVQSYGGSFVSLPFPSIRVHVHEGTAAPARSDAPVLPQSLEDAFAASPAVLPVGGGEGSPEDARILADLYERERLSFPFFNRAMEERQALERQLGRDALPPIPRRPLFAIILALCAASALLVVVFVLRKFFAKAAFCLVITMLFVVSALLYGSRMARRIAVCKGGALYSVPERRLSQGGSLPAASVVKVVNQAGDWLYVSFNGTNGWIPLEDVILVR
jgi:hypothetical protein